MMVIIIINVLSAIDGIRIQYTISITMIIIRMMIVVSINVILTIEWHPHLTHY